jgi:hypothetical protein
MSSAQHNVARQAHNLNPARPHVVFAAGHGATPDATGAGKVNGNAAQFTWKDSQGNTGTGTINLAGDDIVVSLKTVHVADPRCLAFYRDNMKLKRIGKK